MAAVLPLLPERHRAAPKPALLWALGVAAVASCAATVALGSLNDELPQGQVSGLECRWWWGHEERAFGCCTGVV